ncbi:histidinol-phosphate/aromatic aminotransferase/cobyric acid decarboxylase-like protein [Bradyrhizobium sp. GM5.1]
MREHGGNLDQAQQRFGGRAEDWIDLSTGINRLPYPVGEVSSRAWSALPSRAEIEALHQAARHAYRTSAAVVALGGAQAAIQLLPQLAPPGRARILAPTYNEYAGVLSAAGWEVQEVGDFDALAGADLAIVVNPNNPDGRCHPPRDLLTLLPRVGRLVVDESFADVAPAAIACIRGPAGAADPALLRKVLWPCRPAARLRARQFVRHRQGRGDIGTLAGLGSGDRDRLSRSA